MTFRGVRRLAAALSNDSLIDCNAAENHIGSRAKLAEEISRKDRKERIVLKLCELCELRVRFFPGLTHPDSPFYMENEDNKPIAKNGADKRQSAWKRFLTLYTTLYAVLLPLVVFITLVCQLLFRKWCGFILFDLLCFVPFFAIYLLSVCISLVLIPAILIGIKTHDNAVHEKGNNRRFTKSRGKHQESKFSLFVKVFVTAFSARLYIFSYTLYYLEC